MSILKSVLRGGVAAQPIAARLPCARAAGGGHTAHLQKPKAPPSLHLHAHQHHPANAPFHIQGIRRAPPHIKGAHGSAIAGYSPLALPPDDHPYAPYVRRLQLPSHRRTPNQLAEVKDMNCYSTSERLGARGYLNK
eukprot:GHVT01077863.1.p1 GENE.GHVT01077863.1~~GHVT01077863.1.p1  ORF type:complete len:136 (-),score=16.10 GHVT01077863.1:1629-2036(-)